MYAMYHLVAGQSIGPSFQSGLVGTTAVQIIVIYYQALQSTKRMGKKTDTVVRNLKFLILKNIHL